MQKRHDKASALRKLCMGILLLFLTVIGIYLSYCSVRYSCYDFVDRGTWSTLMQDNPLKNILVILCVAAFVYGLDLLLKKMGHKQNCVGYVVLAICCVITAAIGFWWVNRVPYYPEGDQLIASAAGMYFRHGDFSMLSNDGYIGIYSQQKGLAFIYEILFTVFGDLCYGIVAKLHVILGVVTLIFGYLFIAELTSEVSYRVVYCILFVICIPYIILLPYIYGDLPSICFYAVLFWSASRFAKTEKIRYAVISCIMSVLAILERTNSWIVLIAVCIGMILLALEKKKIRAIFLGIFCALSAFLALKALDISYELRSGHENTHGTPAVLWIAMGMQEGFCGPGTYNRYQQDVLEMVEFDRKAAADVAKQEIRNRLKVFRDNPEYGREFFKIKIQSQWVSPLFAMLHSTGSFSEEDVASDVVREIYFGKYHDTVYGFADRYQSVVYIGFLGVVFQAYKKRRSSAFYIPLITIVGGFLFSIIWEAQSRYVFPYYMFMIMYAPMGLYFWAEMFICICRKIFDKYFKSNNKIEQMFAKRTKVW